MSLPYPSDPAHPWPALRSIRIGCVQYLNSRPLIHAYDGPVAFEHPSSLAALLAAGKLDAALVPVFEPLRDPRYLLVDGAAVASDGPVFSVYLAHRGPLSEIRRVALDPASRTSAHLVRVLLAEFHGLQPEYGPTGDAQLLIGNQAIQFRLSPEAEDFQFLDLGEEWKRCTGLPFVFALWALRAGLPDASAIAAELRRLKTAGLARLDEIIAKDRLATPEFRKRYLSEHIVFDAGEAGRAAVARYRELLAKHGWIASAHEPLRWV